MLRIKMFLVRGFWIAGLTSLTVPFPAMGGDEITDFAGWLMDEIESLHGYEFEAEGLLKLALMQLDESDPSFVVQIGDTKYDARLDDGRATSRRAMSCGTENFFKADPTKGCPVSFSAEYVVERRFGHLEVELILWDVQFKQAQ